MDEKVTKTIDELKRRIAEFDTTDWRYEPDKYYDAAVTRTETYKEVLAMLEGV
jgi:hypothetical protein